jgi:phosphoglycolate phosphatase-like HAD superfamily hydrolase
MLQYDNEHETDMQWPPDQTFMPNAKAVVFDLDHTICDSAWRDHLLPGAPHWQGWDAYHQHQGDDPVVPHVKQLVWSIRNGGSPIVICTARPHKWVHQTQEWLREHRVPYDCIVMRPGDDDVTPSCELKVKLMRYLFKGDLSRIAFVVDDRDDVLTSFAQAGVPGLKIFPQV